MMPGPPPSSFDAKPSRVDVAIGRILKRFLDAAVEHDALLDQQAEKRTGFLPRADLDIPMPRQKPAAPPMQSIIKGGWRYRIITDDPR